MLDEQLFKLKKREKMISQLQSNITKESYRKCEKQAEQLKGSNTKDNDVYNKEKSIKTRIQMYKSYKNLKNGKIRLCRKSSEDTSEIESERSESKKMISEGSVSKHSVHSTASAKKAKKNIKKKDFLDSKSKSFISRDHYSEEYDSDYVKSSRSTRNMKAKTKKAKVESLNKDTKIVQSKTGKPPISKGTRINKPKLARPPAESLLPPDRFDSEPRLNLNNEAQLYNSQEIEGRGLNAQYTLDRRRRKKHKRDPVKKYLKMKEHTQIPLELRNTLINRKNLSKGYLVSIYGISGEKQLKDQKKKLADIKSRSCSAFQRSQMML